MLILLHVVMFYVPRDVGTLWNVKVSVTAPPFLTFRGPCIVIYSMIKANEMNYFSTLFGKELYMFRTDLLSIIRSLNTVFTAIGTCHASYVDYLLARSGWITSMANTNCCEYSKSVRNM